MDKQVLVANLCTIGLLFLVSVMICSCTFAIGSGPGSGSVEAYAAEMVAAVNGALSSSRIIVHEGKLWLEVSGGRRSSVMIVRYDLDRLWVLVPGEARFKEFPLASMGSQFPHFFSPRIRITKDLIGRERLDGKDARKYQVRVLSDNGMPFEGYLWETVGLSGFPLKWEDQRANIVVRWKDVGVQIVPLALFSVPAHFSEICADPASPAHGPLPGDHLGKPGSRGGD